MNIRTTKYESEYNEEKRWDRSTVAAVVLASSSSESLFSSKYWVKALLGFAGIDAH